MKINFDIKKHSKELAELDSDRFYFYSKWRLERGDNKANYDNWLLDSETIKYEHIASVFLPIAEELKVGKINMVSSDPDEAFGVGGYMQDDMSLLEAIIESTLTKLRNKKHSKKLQGKTKT